MHILIIPSEHFLTSNYPLGGIFQFHQAVALHGAGYKVGVISPGATTSRFVLKPYVYPQFELNHGFPIYRHYRRAWYPQRWLKPHAGIKYAQKQGILLYKRYKEQFGAPDLIHAHNIKYAGFIAQAIGIKEQIPYVITEHSSLFLTSDLKPDWSHAMKRVATNGMITAVSQSLASSIQHRLNVKKVGVLPNIIDPFFMESPLVRRHNKAFVFLNIASLDANKNQAHLIKAFAQYFRGQPAQLRIGGQGPLERQLKKLAEELSVNEQVIFLGLLDRPSVLREMQSADCFVLPSFYETFGVVLIEALASGTPIIATQCGGANDIVTEKNGLLVQLDDVVDLGDAMKRMFEAKAQYHPQLLRQECQNRFGTDAFLHRVSALYTQAIGQV